MNSGRFTSTFGRVKCDEQSQRCEATKANDSFPSNASESSGIHYGLSTLFTFDETTRVGESEREF